MVRKNRHRTDGQEEARAIERIQKAFQQAIGQFERLTGRPVVQVAPQPTYRAPIPLGLSIPVVDLTEKDTIPLNRYEELANRADDALDEYYEYIELDENPRSDPRQAVSPVSVNNDLGPRCDLRQSCPIALLLKSRRNRSFFLW